MRWILTLFTALLLAGCAEFFSSDVRRSGASSSLVDYLYPEGQVPPGFDERVPRLDLPLRVGLAFVPTSGNRVYQAPVLAEADKARLLELVRDRFSDRQYIGSIEIIPDTYLRSTRGFDGVEQVARLYGVGRSMRELRGESFAAAVDDMAGNLAVELERFEERLKNQPEVADVRWRDERSGGSAVGPLSSLLLFPAWLLRRRPGQVPA